MAKKLGVGESARFRELENEPYIFDEIDDDTNIRRCNESEIYCITYTKLIDKIISGDPDTQLVKTFVHNYQLVCESPEEFFLALVKRTMVPSQAIMAPSEKEVFT